jgi:hypothetical protein
VASVYGGTVCLQPVNPRSFAAVATDERYECALPCRVCENCRRWQRLQLRRRLKKGFGSCQEKLWTLQVECSPSSVGRVLRSIRRTMTPSCWQGFVRSGTDGVVIIVAGARPTLSAKIIGQIGSWCVKRVKDSKRLRAWRVATAGLLVSRDSFGENVNRYYIRGLPKLDRELMQIETQGGLRKRHPESQQGFRAWRDGLTLYPAAKSRREIRSLSLNRQCAAGASMRATRAKAEPVGIGAMPAGLIQRDALLRPLPKGGGDATSVPVPADIQGLIDRLAALARQRGRGS